MARRYHGTAGHFIGADRCCFRLHTTINNRFKVSTVGCYHPLHGDVELAYPIGHDRTYETMVFDLLAPEGERWSEIDSRGYSDEDDAEAGHEAMCAKYDRG